MPAKPEDNFKAWFDTKGQVRPSTYTTASIVVDFISSCFPSFQVLLKVIKTLSVS